MKRHLIMFALMGAWSAPALGQAPVFFDDFDGNALLPHWNQPPTSYWEHDVSNSMLNVTGLFNPSHPKSPSNFTGIGAAFGPQTDFQADVWMGWDAGQAPHRLSVTMASAFGTIAEFGYWNEFIFARPGDAPPVFMPAPDAGVYQFGIGRAGTQINFYFNGNPFASFQDNFGYSAIGLGFFFLGPYPGELGDFHIDRVQVVPAPGTLLPVLLGGLALTGRRRR